MADTAIFLQWQFLHAHYASAAMLTQLPVFMLTIVFVNLKMLCWDIFTVTTRLELPTLYWLPVPYGVCLSAAVIMAVHGAVVAPVQAFM